MRLALGTGDWGLRRSSCIALFVLAGCGAIELVSQPEGGSGGGGSGPTSTSGTGDGGAGGTGSGFAVSGQGGVGGQGGEQPGPACGDGVVDAGEACDDGNGDSADGCTGTCDAIESGFACPAPGEACVSTVVCGDGNITGDETCDDFQMVPTSGDGCSEQCKVEPGWTCPDVGAACEAAQCGDGIVAGDEECEDDDAPPSDGDGCSATCQLEPGFKCDVPQMPCVPTVCGDGLVEGSEQCDDGNNNFGDGCTPLFCVREPDCMGSPASSCTTSCGDSILLPGGVEACDDGNTAPGDGCSPTCTVEPGYDCAATVANEPTLTLPIVLRDFKIEHPDFQYVIGNDPGIVQSLLGADGKPVYAGSANNPTTTNQANFDQWYRDVANVNQTILQTLTFAQLMSGAYRYDNSNFFPLDGLAWGNEGNNHNFHFTSEVRYWFTYQGGESLDFTGDDDVWVFVNKQLAVDLGGVHGAQSAGIVLDAAKATQFNLVVGQVYEIVVFQAERHTTQSNYRLTLGKFAKGTSECVSDCGDGIKTPDEACDDGVNDGSYGSCTPECKRGPRCGDGVVQNGFEECDDGVNLTPYEGCAPGCKLGSSCGDGVVDSLFGEQCDDGVNDGGYAQCAPGCLLGDRCGDGVVQAPEECDDGNKNANDVCSNDCKQTAPQ